MDTVKEILNRTKKSQYIKCLNKDLKYNTRVETNATNCQCCKWQQSN